MTLHFYWTCMVTQKRPSYWYARWFFVWCLQRQRNGGLNSGQKSANIVTDAFQVCEYSRSHPSSWSALNQISNRLQSRCIFYLLIHGILNHRHTTVDSRRDGISYLCIASWQCSFVHACHPHPSIAAMCLYFSSDETCWNHFAFVAPQCQQDDWYLVSTLMIYWSISKKHETDCLVISKTRLFGWKKSRLNRVYELKILFCH